MSLFARVNAIAELTAARNVSLTEFTAATVSGLPSSTVDGIDVSDTVRATYRVRMRRNVNYRTSTVTITYVAATTYRVTINGTNVDTAANTDLATTLGDIATAINGSGVASAVTAVASATNVVITGDSEAAYSVAVSITAGSGTIACVADPESAEIGIYFRNKSTTDTAWVLGNALTGTLDSKGFEETLAVGPYSRTYLHLHTVAGHASDGGTVTYDPLVTLGAAIAEVG